MKRFYRPALVIAIVLLLSGYFARNLIFGTPVEAHAVVQGELRQTVVASGRITWPQRISVAAEVTGRVTHIPVKEGQAVKRGDLLIQLADSTDRASLAQATTAVALAEAKLRQQREVGLPTAQQTLRQAQADAEQTRQQLTRVRTLNNQKYLSKTELDTAQRNLDVANSKLEAAQLQVQSNQPKGSDALLATTALNQARASLQLAQVKLAQTTILAPADGTLISRSIEPGDIATAGKALMVLAAQGETQIEVQIDEKNLAKLAVGQVALSSADAFPQQRFNAEVAYINPGVDATRGAVEVKLRVKEPPAYLRQDMTVSVDIETAKKPDALVIPTGALHEPSSDAPWVLVVRNNHTVKQTVTLGLRGDENVEVLGGLAAGEAVILANLALIKADQRVRVTLPP
ncbi:efflux RND transporter periplasmic adaptor subunit [Thiothrix subterranea]|uniref:Efflux RND transporter periplasmic adaptor subunit n=1 Tax=Thiothrix subterranea TaxID=2735563 RepID=A0AA51QW21_9GAMM|nr:efflux RND transporter periplasmic adaptor subunit [Thiothrix subterranea]MDQ5767789.1 efflux RND transporter periplasmic adaptor subunit [Thiothrix subterranea]WML85598.1 efflux RND transporter periplasmic adaptor subunit [Thiothrix subterranea]